MNTDCVLQSNRPEMCKAILHSMSMNDRDENYTLVIKSLPHNSAYKKKKIKNSSERNIYAWTDVANISTVTVDVTSQMSSLT